MANQAKASKDTKSKAQPVEGEGSTTATRAYNGHLARAVADKASIQRGADQARRAVEGPEGKALRAAEKQGKAGPKAAARR